MDNDLYTFTDYKKYLGKKSIVEAKKTKSFKSKMAQALSCHPSHLSQVLNANTHLTLEQGEKLNHFLPHNKEQSKYFLLLLQKARAGTTGLKSFFDEQIQEIQQSREDLKKRLEKTESLSPDQHNKYYSAWYYSAIHVILSIPAYQDSKVIARRFNLPVDLVLEVIDFLENAALIEKK